MLVDLREEIVVQDGYITSIFNNTGSKSLEESAKALKMQFFKDCCAELTGIPYTYIKLLHMGLSTSIQLTIFTVTMHNFKAAVCGM